MARLFSLLIVLLLPAVAAACIWDSDTLQDELKQNATTFHVITGQYARHGKAYYRERLKRAQLELERSPDSIETLYDLGAAHLRLGNFDKALAAFERVEHIAPDRYKTLANLSVVFGEQGHYATAYEHMAKALAKNPGAHFGAGWLHLEMVGWLGTLWETGEPGVSFLGGSYSDPWQLSIHRAARERAKQAGVELDEDFDGVKLLTTLLRANPDFADGYLVLGASLHDKFDLNLALWAYMKAKALDHPRPGVIDKRIDAIFEHWKDAIKHGGGTRGTGVRVEPKAEALAKIEQELEAAKAYLVSFRAHEARLVEAGGDLPDFDTVRASLAEEGVAPRPPIQAGLLGRSSGQARPVKGGPANGAPHQKAQAREANGPPVGGITPARALDLTPAPDEAATDAPRQGLPWFVWFGFAALGVSLAAALVGRARRT